MQTIQASEAKTHLLKILDNVEQGATVVITRHGKPIARISPQVEVESERAKRAFAGIRALRERTQRVSLDEILSARDEGRR